jgi:hypothetical protein
MDDPNYDKPLYGIGDLIHTGTVLSHLSRASENPGNHLQGSRFCFLRFSSGQGVSALVILLSVSLLDMKQKTN